MPTQTDDVTLAVTPGASLDVRFRFEHELVDEEGTVTVVPKSLAGSTFAMYFQNQTKPYIAIAVTCTAALATTDDNNVVQVEATSTEVAKLSQGNHWALWRTEPDGDTYPILTGMIKIKEVAGP